MINSRQNFFSKNIFSNLYVLIPVALITGPFIPDLIFVIICLYFLVNFKNFRNDEIFNYKFHYFFILFYISICFSSIISDYNSYSIKSSLFYIRFGVFSLATYFLILNDRKCLLLITKIFLIIYSLLLIDSFFQYLFGFNLFGWTFEGHKFYVTSFFGEDEVLGSYVARFFPFVLSLLIFSKEELNFKFNNILIIFIFASASLITLISGERTSMALLFLSIFIMFLTCHKLRKLILISYLTIILTITLIVLSSDITKERMYNQTIDQLGLSGESERLVIFSKTYESHYLIAFKMFKQKPILGYGPKTFRKFCAEPENYVNEIACTTHPHNILMQLLSETGIIGASFYFFIFIFLAITLFKISIKGIFFNDKSQKDYITLIFIFYFINLFPLAPSGNFFNNWLSMIYYLPLGYFFYLLKYKQKT